MYLNLCLSKCVYIVSNIIMGAKTSTANGANGTASSGPPHHQHHMHSQSQHNPQSPRTRTFSSSSSSATEVIPPGGSSSGGFSLLRAIPGMHVTTASGTTGSAANQSTIDRQRARSLSSVPDLQSNGNGTTQSNYLNGKHSNKRFNWLLRCIWFYHIWINHANQIDVSSLSLSDFMKSLPLPPPANGLQ